MCCPRSGLVNDPRRPKHVGLGGSSHPCAVSAARLQWSLAARCTAFDCENSCTRSVIFAAAPHAFDDAFIVRIVGDRCVLCRTKQLRHVRAITVYQIRLTRYRPPRRTLERPFRAPGRNSGIAFGTNPAMLEPGRRRIRPQLPTGIVFCLHPGIPFTFAPERFSRSSPNRVHLPPEPAHGSSLHFRFK